jgi:hypothetical protein
VRYALLHNHVKSVLACGHELPYDATVRGLEAAMRQLHNQLLEQGWAARPENGSTQRTSAPAMLPERDTAGGLTSYGFL